MSGKRWGRRSSDNQPYPKAPDIGSLPKPNFPVVHRWFAVRVIVKDEEDFPKAFQMLESEGVINKNTVIDIDSRQFLFFARGKISREWLRNRLLNIDVVSPSDVVEGRVVNGKFISDTS